MLFAIAARSESMSNLNRVQAGIPEGGQFSEAAMSRPDLPPLDENLAQTWSQEYVSSVNADGSMDSLENSIAQYAFVTDQDELPYHQQIAQP